MEFRIENTQIYGLTKSIIASGNAMRTEMDYNVSEYFEKLSDGTLCDTIEYDYSKDYKRACNLGNTKCGEGHDNFLNGVIVQFDIYAPLYMWKQIQRYHWMDFISSQSTMHKLTKFKVAECCVKYTDKIILNRYQELLDEYNNFDIVHEKEWEENPNEMQELKNEKWYTLVASLPCGFVLGATMTTNYRQLKTIYSQRKYHKLKEWEQFREWCKKLPYFKELCLKNIDKEEGEIDD